MLPDPATGHFRRQRSRLLAASALAVAILLSAPAAGIAGTIPARTASVSTDASRAITDAPARPASSTSQVGQQRRADSSSAVLPIVLAAILFLALLVPSSGFYSHGRWHSR